MVDGGLAQWGNDKARAMMREKCMMRWGDKARGCEDGGKCQIDLSIFRFLVQKYAEICIFAKKVVILYRK